MSDKDKKDGAAPKTGFVDATIKKAKKAATAAAIANRRFRVLPILALVAIVAACIATQDAHPVNYAMLYMIAENGKKSGRADGNVYMRNGRIRGMAIPTLVRNAYTSIARNGFGSLSAAFRSLTQAQIKSWNASTGFFKSDRFGRPIAITGKALFNMLNGNLQDIGLPAIDNPQVAAAVDGITSFDLTIDFSALTAEIDFLPDPTAANVVHKVFATAPLGPGISRPGSSQYRLISRIASAAAAPFNMQAAYLTKFGQPPVGSKVFVKLVPVNNVTGQAGVPVLNDTIVVA